MQYRSLLLAMAAMVCTACAFQQRVEPPAGPPTPADFLVDSRVVGTLERGEIVRHAPKQLTALDPDHAARWQECGAKIAASAEYRVADDASQALRALVIEFASPRGAFCGFTSGRNELATRVPELEAAFEQPGLARVWRGKFLVEVRALADGVKPGNSRGLLKATAMGLPGKASPTIPGSTMLPENTLVPGSERIVPRDVLPTMTQPALVADVHCTDDAMAHAMVIDYPTEAEAKAALEAYHGNALESFFEVNYTEREGAKGLEVSTGEQFHVLFVSGTRIVGLIDLLALEPCAEPLAEVAARAAPIAAQ